MQGNSVERSLKLKLSLAIRQVVFETQQNERVAFYIETKDYYIFCIQFIDQSELFAQIFLSPKHVKKRSKIFLKISKSIFRLNT